MPTDVYKHLIPIILNELLPLEVASATEDDRRSCVGLMDGWDSELHGESWNEDTESRPPLVDCIAGQRGTGAIDMDENALTCSEETEATMLSLP